MQTPNQLGLKWYTVKVTTSGENASTYMCEFLCLSAEEAERRALQMVALEGDPVESVHVQMKYPESGTAIPKAPPAPSEPPKRTVTPAEARALAAFVLVPVNVASVSYVQQMEGAK